MTDRLDRTQVERLNTLWAIVDAPVAEGGARARLAAVVRRLMSRVLARQQEFNAALVDHLNRNMPALDTAVARLADLERHREALLARERRSDAAVAAVAATHAELRAAVNVLQQATQNLKRQIERVGAAASGSPVGGPGGPEGPQLRGPAEGSQLRGPADGPQRHPANQFADLDSHKYVGFEEQFRGSSDDIRRRVADYVAIFDDRHDVLDIGCGRGEFLALLREKGITGHGIDLNPSMVEVCRERGLDATAADALSYLRTLPDGSLGGLFSAQVVEHLEPRYLTQLLDAAYDKLRPGSPIVLETINPACWFAFFESYVRDITHVRPLHPDTLKYLLVASGFHSAEIRYSAPYPEAEKLQPVASTPDSAPTALADWAETINANVEKINRLLFTWLDYAAIGWRG